MRAFTFAFSILPLFILGCSPDDKPKDNIAYVGANLLGYNHVANTNINWFSVNGYRGRTGGFTCCIMLAEIWQPNMQVNIKWEVNPDPFPKNMPPLGTNEFREFMKKRKPITDNIKLP